VMLMEAMSLIVSGVLNTALLCCECISWEFCAIVLSSVGIFAVTVVSRVGVLASNSSCLVRGCCSWECRVLFWVDEFLRLFRCCCRIGFALLNRRVHAALAAANRVAGLDVIFNYWGVAFDFHEDVVRRC
jgi:hypothetical protein